MSTVEMWQWVHTCYGDELGLTSDDDDYVAPLAKDDERSNNNNNKKEMLTPVDNIEVNSLKNCCAAPMGKIIFVSNIIEVQDMFIKPIGISLSSKY